jgi:hypothetical protein
MRGKPERGEDKDGGGERVGEGMAIGLRRMEGAAVLRAVNWAARRRWDPLDVRLNCASTSKFGSFRWA